MTSKSGVTPPIDEILALDDAVQSARQHLSSLQGSTSASEGAFRRAMSEAEYAESMLEREATTMAAIIRQQREVIEKMGVALDTLNLVESVYVWLDGDNQQCIGSIIEPARQAAAPFRARGK